MANLTQVGGCDDMKCKSCGAGIVRIQTPTDTVICNAQAITYYPVKGEPISEVLTPNGERHYASLTGKLESAIGIGHTRHTCNEITRGEAK